METRSFIILASKKSSIETQLEKLNRRAKKLNLEPISASWGKAFLETREMMIQDPSDPNSIPEYIKKEVLAIPVEITGPLDVVYDGWQFVATLQHLPTGENIIRSISDEFEIPKQYRNAGSDCQHCNTKRYRKDTYLVRHTTGAVVQVGSTCIKDFLGGNSPDDILNKANLIAELLTYIEGCNGGGGCGVGGEYLYHIEEFLAQTAACIRDHGWLSKGKANIDGGIPTATWVSNNLQPPMGWKLSDYSTVTQSDKDLATKVAEWAENISDEECDKSDYLHNIRAIARSGMVGHRAFGFAASMIAAYNKAMEALAPKTVSSHVGALKSRLTLDLTLKRHFSYDSIYGLVHKFVFNDLNGNILVWSTTTYKNLQEGNSYTVKGTIKAHSEYKGVRQTELTRCEIVNL